jgi:CubicO group peptidase (beta-lactamase class C family)
MLMPNKRLISWLYAVVLVSSICCGAAHAQGVETVWPTRAWQVSTPEAQGMDPAALAKLLDFGRAHRFDSFLIARHGRIVLDAYYAPYTAEIPHVINSATKAVIGTLAAIAIEDGLLDSPEHQMLDFFRTAVWPISTIARGRSRCKICST